MTLLGLLLLPALVLVFNLIIHNAESKLQPEELLATLQASLEVNLVPSLALQLPVLSYSRALRAQGMASESTSAGWVVTNVYYGSSCGTGIGVFSAGVVTNVCMAVTAENVTTSVIVSCDSTSVTATEYASANCTGDVISSNSTEPMCAVLPTELDSDDHVIIVPQMSASWMCVDSSTVQLGSNFALSLLSEFSSCVPPSQYSGIENTACLAFSADGLQLSAEMDYPNVLVYFGSTCQGFAVYTLEIPNPGQCLPADDSIPYYADVDDGLAMPYEEFTLASTVAYVFPEPSPFPSPAPTRTPTVVNTARPTAPLSTAQSVQYSVLQVLDQVDVDTYTADLSLNNEVLAEAVASCMDGVTSDEISVTAVSAATNAAIFSRRLQSNSTSTLVNYTVSIPNTAVAGYSSGAEAYNATTADLENALQTGVFTTTLQDCAFSLGASALETASSTTATTSSAEVGPAEDDDSGGDSDSQAGIRPGAVAAVSVAVLCSVAMIATGAYMYRKASITLTTEVNAVEMETRARADVVNPMLTATAVQGTDQAQGLATPEAVVVPYAKATEVPVSTA